MGSEYRDCGTACQLLFRNYIELVHGSGNVFRDLGDPQADLKQAKAVLAARIIAVLDDRGLAVRKAASLTGFAAADFSRIRNADLGRFTLDRLMKMLAALDANARVTVKVDRSRSAPAAASPVDRKPSLAEVLSRLAPLEEDFPHIEDPRVEPEEIL